ncbi:50S ribosomal protein L3, partial [bacterium]|nr:50S ribosomal protein L3 [bacterium]
GEVMRGKKMAGHLGDERVTVGNLQVVDVLPDENLIVIKGAVPGAKGQLVVLKKQGV